MTCPLRALPPPPPPPPGRPTQKSCCKSCCRARRGWGCQRRRGTRRSAAGPVLGSRGRVRAAAAPPPLHAPPAAPAAEGCRGRPAAGAGRTPHTAQRGPGGGEQVGAAALRRSTQHSCSRVLGNRVSRRPWMWWAHLPAHPSQPRQPQAGPGPHLEPLRRARRQLQRAARRGHHAVDDGALLLPRIRQRTSVHLRDLGAGRRWRRPGSWAGTGRLPAAVKPPAATPTPAACSRARTVCSSTPNAYTSASKLSRPSVSSSGGWCVTCVRVRVEEEGAGRGAAACMPLQACTDG